MEGETSMKPAQTITVIFLLLVSLVHLLRLVFQWKVTANTVVIPLWMSAAACIFTAALAIWLWQENKK
jgi:protein-S-isoprenylcysteine O-methyltransferase Ste14